MPVCPECEELLDLEDYTDIQIGEVITCIECGEDLELISDCPIEFAVCLEYFDEGLIEE